MGGGGIINLASIIVSDLVPLVERGAYQGMVVLAWAFAAAIGPVIVRNYAFSRDLARVRPKSRGLLGRLACAKGVVEMALL